MLALYGQIQTPSSPGLQHVARRTLDAELEIVEIFLPYVNTSAVKPT